MDVAPGGLRYGLLAGAAGVAAFLISPFLAVPFLAAAAAAVAFHRDPERSAPPGGVVAPADGTVNVLREEDGRVLVGTFMNVHDVHVNRVPLAGTVTSVEHVEGGYRPAFSKSSERNERVHVDVDTEYGPMRVTLIAGAFARRIHPYVEEGDDLDRGERIGHITFGSRVDVRLPPSIGREDVAVARGESVTAGETRLVVPGSMPSGGGSHGDTVLGE